MAYSFMSLQFELNVKNTIFTQRCLTIYSHIACQLHNILTYTFISSPIPFIYIWVPFVIITIFSFPQSWLITGFVTIVSRRMPYVDEERITPPKYLSYPPVLVLFVLLDRCLSFFDLRFLFTTFVSSKFSYPCIHVY
jgi:hypothetical protein